VVITNILRDMDGMEQSGGASTQSGMQTFHRTSTTGEVGAPVVRILVPSEPLPRLLEAHLYKLNETCSILTSQWLVRRIRRRETPFKCW
jgi:hypothetical protein